ncbi:MAG: glycosyltransferase family 4 protein, partial [Mameliella sp.]|nr:glycosyltransferase family 4 protein [Phaeodactylibacter sp.]
MEKKTIEISDTAFNIGFPHPPGHGGPGSFQSRLEREIRKLNWGFVYAGAKKKPDVIIIVGGTKRLLWLWRMKRADIPVIYRLDGINWLHRKKKVGVKSYVLGEVRNFLNKCIHAFFADHVVYQSQFVKTWWEKEGWKKHRNSTIIYNGVDLSEFQPKEAKAKPDCLLCLEGNIDYSPYAVDLVNELAEKLQGQLQVLVHGNFEYRESRRRLSSRVDYCGKIDRKDLPQAYKNAIYLSLDVNAACPNTVVEASLAPPMIAQ